MRSTLDFSSWQGILSTLLGLVLVSFVAIGIRLLLMHGVQLRRERQNRQINERLKTLIAAYKTLGGSFTGELAVDPRHLRELRLQTMVAPAAGSVPAAATPAAGAPAAGAAARSGSAEGTSAASGYDPAGSDRRRRTRDAVEAALSDVILLGTHEQVRLAAHAAQEMVAGRPVATAALVVSLRDFIRDVLDLEAVAVDLTIPSQGPARSGGGSARGGRGDKAGNAGGGRGGGGGGGGSGGGGGGTAAAGSADDGGVALAVGLVAGATALPPAPATDAAGVSDPARRD